MTWYYHVNGENRGPVEVLELRQLHATGQIQDDTLVWQEGMPEWSPYSTSAATAAASAFPVATAVATPASPDLRACTECGKIYPLSDLLAYEDRLICPACKPLFFQRAREGVTQPGTLRYAGIGARFGAVFLDGLLLDFIIIFPVMFLVGSFRTHVTPGQPLGPLQVLGMAIEYLVPALYEILMIGAFGATLGKMAAKVRVVTAEGGKVGYGCAVGRYFAKILSGLIIGIGYFMAFWDSEKRALHDRICGTRVITTRP